MLAVFHLSTSSMLGFSLACMLLTGFFLTRITKLLHFPNVTAYIIAGVILGPCCLGIIPSSLIDNLDFITDFALGLIAFGVGRYFRFQQLKHHGRQLIVLTFAEALITAIIVSTVMFLIFHVSLPFALLLGAIASATAPASTIMTIRQYHAKGQFVDTLLQVVALDDAVSILAFSVAAAMAEALAGGTISIASLTTPLIDNALAITIGLCCGGLLHFLINSHRSDDNRLMIALSMILILSAVCSVLDVSPLLCCMALGAMYLNLSDDIRIFDQIGSFAAPIMTLFFIVSGMNLDINALHSVGLLGIGFFIFRIIGKIIGAAIGAKAINAPSTIRNYLGLALIPSAGVAIGLAALGERILPASSGSMLSAIILSSAILYEIIGPFCARTALLLSGSIKDTKLKIPNYIHAFWAFTSLKTKKN